MFQRPELGKVILYGASYCPYCVKAEKLLTQNGIAFTKVDITHDEAGRLVVMNLSGGQQTVPQIFFGHTHVGGYDDLEKLEKKGALFDLLGQNNIS